MADALFAPTPKEWLKKRYLVGVDLTDDEKEDFQPEMFEMAADQALEWARGELDLPIKKAPFVERLDYRFEDWREWQFLSLSKTPIDPATLKVRYRFGNNTVAVAPSQWLRLESPTSGQLQIVPDASISGSAFAVVGGFAVWPGGLPYGFSSVPGWFEVEYEAGWADAAIPADIQHIIGMQAAIHILNIAGDLVAGAGIAGYSLGVDSISQSVNTTASAMYGGFSARTNSYEKEIARLLPTLRWKYRGGSIMEVA